ncbi:MAG: Crp/Fnr family transcriptional regulator [Betaproteobacteria bacterium]
MVQRHSPRQNSLLAALPARTYASLLPELQPVALPIDTTIHIPGDRESHLYFIAEGLVSSDCVTRNGASAEFALTGNEGAIGLASVLGGESSPSRAVVVSEGYAYRLPASIAKSDLEHEGPLGRLLLRYTLALIAQAGQVAACNRHHSLEQRLCRLMLWSVDRLPSNELAMKQDSIAEMLGVRREGVSEAAASLRRQGLIRYTRGCIAVVDRSAVETRACECYAVVKREYDRLLPPRHGAVHAGARESLCMG